MKIESMLKGRFLLPRPGLRAAVLCVYAWALVSADTLAQPLSLTPAYPGLTFSQPLDVQTVPDGSNRLVVVERRGRVYAFPDQESVRKATEILNIEGRVLSEGMEEGLLALEFHPNFPKNGLFFVYYSARAPRRTVLSRFRADLKTLVADATSESVLLEVEQPYSNHNGGDLLFAPDGTLYLSIGDGGSAGDPHGNGQNLKTLLGKIIRIDVSQGFPWRSYGVPSTNPFANRKDVRPEIWAYGLRNPWRMFWDRDSGLLYAADVGQNRIEEINIIERGKNYGWAIKEGSSCFRPKVRCEKIPGLADPVAEYTHDKGVSVTGGVVYRGKKFPNWMGVYLFADFISGRIWGIRIDPEKLRSTYFEELGQVSANIATFGVDPRGELLVTSLFEGRLYRFERRR